MNGTLLLAFERTPTNPNVFTIWASLVAQSIKNLPAIQETWVQFLGWDNPLEKEMATHSGILAWRIPFTEESGRLQSLRSQELDTTEPLSLFRYLKIS